MSNYDPYVAELLEDIDESDEPTESDEERARPRLPLRNFARGRVSVPSRAPGNLVTTQQLNSALAKVSGQIRTNADATKALGVALGKRIDAETAARKKDTGSGRMMGILPLLLARPPELVITRATPTDPTSAVTNVTVKSTSDNLLPLILLMGMGGMGGGEGKGGTDEMMLPLLLLFALPPTK